MKKATACQRCASADLYHGSYCRPCWRIRERELKFGDNPPPAQERKFLKNGDPCPGCGIPIELQNKHISYALCQKCGNAKRLKYQRDRRRATVAKNNPATRVKRTVMPNQRPELKRKAIKPADQQEVIIVPKNIKITRVPSACPSFREYCFGPNFS